MKYISLLFIFCSIIYGANYKAFQNALQKGQYDKGISIYSEAINGEETIKFQNYLYKYIIKLMKKDLESAQNLISLYLDIEYENHVGLFLYSQIYLLKGDYKNSLELLYKLKSYHLQNNLSSKVDKTFETTRKSYLEELYSVNNLDELKELIDYFTSYDDIDSIKKTQFTLVKLQENLMELAKYNEALNILYWLKNTSIEEDFTTQVNKKINYSFKKIVKALFEQKDTKQLENLLELTLLNNDTINNPLIEENLNKLKEKSNLAQIYKKAIPLTKRGSHFLMNVNINGQNLNLMIDTGATYTSLNKNITDILDYTVVKDEIFLYTANGSIKEKLIEVDQLQVEDISLKKFQLVTSQIDSPNDDGVIGMNFFKKFDFKIDQEENILYLSGK